MRWLRKHKKKRKIKQYCKQRAMPLLCSIFYSLRISRHELPIRRTNHFIHIKLPIQKLRLFFSFLVPCVWVYFVISEKMDTLLSLYSHTQFHFTRAVMWFSLLGKQANRPQTNQTKVIEREKKSASVKKCILWLHATSKLNQANFFPSRKSACALNWLLN